MSFEQNLQQWINLDNQIKSATEKLKEMREKKAQLTETLVEGAAEKDLENKVFTVANNKFRFIETKTTETLTFKYLEKSLNEIIKNEEQVKQIINYLKTNRESSYSKELKRY
jgi:hypothetical protein